ncbi:MAG: hypothetical protein AAGH60_11860 [Pseudomonadota bacterium]
MPKLTAATASLINAAILLIGGGFAYVFPTGNAWSAVWPATAGMVLLICHAGVQAENKVVAHIAVVLTLVVFVGLLPQLQTAFLARDLINTTRLVIMELSTLVALIFFIKSFRDARKPREAAVDQP